MNRRNYSTPRGIINPYILEEGKMDVSEMGVFSRLFKERIICFPSDVSPDSCSVVMSQLLYLDHVDPKATITMYVNSPGGDVLSGMGLVETMMFIKAPICTINTGMCASMGSLILAAGNKGMRKSLPSSKVLIHQPWTGNITGNADEIRIEALELEKHKNNLFSFLAARCNKTVEEIKAAAHRDCWLSAQEALEWGLIDEIIDIDWSGK